MLTPPSLTTKAKQIKSIKSVNTNQKKKTTKFDWLYGGDHAKWAP